MEAAEKQRRDTEPLAHPISRGVEFKIGFGLQTVRIDKVKLVNETRGTGYGLSMIMRWIGFPRTRFVRVAASP
jgi:hypothetical protein